MSKAAEHSKLQCDPLKSLHIFDRRDFIKDQQGNYLLDARTGEPQINTKCACGKTSSNASEYRGGEQQFVYAESHK